MSDATRILLKAWPLISAETKLDSDLHLRIIACALIRRTILVK